MLFVLTLMLINGETARAVPYPGLEFPTAKDSGSLIYSPTRTLANIELVGGTTGAGTFAWTEPNKVPTCDIDKYSVTFTPKDAGYDSVTDSITLVIKKATPETIVFPIAESDLVYKPNFFLSDVTLSGGSGDGSFRWKDGDNTILKAVTDTYYIEFVPRDTTNYDYTDVKVSEQKQVTIKKASGEVSFPERVDFTYQVDPNKNSYTLKDFRVIDYASRLDNMPVGGNGTFEWKDKALPITVNLTSATIVFVPDPNYNFENISLEKTITINVSKANPDTIVFPTTVSTIYSPSQKLSQISLLGGSGDGTFDWDSPNTVPQVSETSYTVKFTPRDAVNYDYSDVVCTSLVSLEVIKATPSQVVFPSVKSSQIKYDPSATLSIITLSGGSGDGTFAWANPTQTPVVNVSEYAVVFTPNDDTNYNYTGVLREKNISLTVTKASPFGIVFPTAGTITYSPTKTLEQIPFNANTGSGDGTFAWSQPDTIPKSNISAYSVTFTPSDAVNYESLLYDVGLKVEKLVLSNIENNGVIFPTNAGQVTYAENSKLSAISISGVSQSYPGNFEWVNPNTVPVVNVLQYEAVFIPDDSDVIGFTKFVVLNVAQAIATTIPEVGSLVAVSYSESLTLGDIGFSDNSEGEFVWENQDINPHVNNEGYTVVFKPYNNSNYNYANLECKIQVSPTIMPATPSYIAPTGLKATFGELLKNVELPAGFTWDATEETTVGAVGEQSFSVKYLPIVNSFNYLQIENIAVKVLVEKATKVQKPEDKTVKVLERSGSSITFESSDDLEYSIDGGETWQATTTFKGLKPQQEYLFLIRYKENESYLASTEYYVLLVKTPMSWYVALGIVLAGFACASLLFFAIYMPLIKSRSPQRNARK
jgi:hypothetical protein